MRDNDVSLRLGYPSSFAVCLVSVPKPAAPKFHRADLREEQQGEHICSDKFVEGNHLRRPASIPGEEALRCGLYCTSARAQCMIPSFRALRGRQASLRTWLHGEGRRSVAALSLLIVSRLVPSVFFCAAFFLRQEASTLLSCSFVPLLSLLLRCKTNQAKPRAGRPAQDSGKRRKRER